MVDLLAPDEVPAVEVREGEGPFVDRLRACVQPHSARPWNARSGRADLDRHIAWDPGAAEVAAGDRAHDRRGDGPAALFAAGRSTATASRTFPTRSRVVSETHADPRQCRTVAASAQGESDQGVLGAVSCGARQAARRAPALPGSRRRWSPCIPSRRSIAASRGRGTLASSPPTNGASPTPCFSVLRRDRRLVVGDNEPYSAEGQCRLHDPPARPRPRPAACDDRDPE